MAASGGTTTSDGTTYMAPELRVERERSSLVLEELTNLLDGGSVMTEKRRRMSENCLEFNIAFATTVSLPLSFSLSSTVYLFSI